jgi:DNA repair exonuclease SbcCD ATPase subunit
MERRLLQLQNESSEQIRQLTDDIDHLQEEKAYVEERLKIAISSIAPLRSMASSSSPPSLYSLSHEPDSKHSTRRDDRRGGGHSSPNSHSYSDDRECSPHADVSGKFSRNAILALERRAALAESSLKQAELREAAAAENFASQLLAANAAKEDEAAAREEVQRKLLSVTESKRQLMLQVASHVKCFLHVSCPFYHLWTFVQLTILEREHTEIKQNLRQNNVALARAHRAAAVGLSSPSSGSFLSPRLSYVDSPPSAAP